jgi:hypothetical protein
MRALAGFLCTAVIACQAGPAHEVLEDTGLHYSPTPRGGTDVIQVAGSSIGTVRAVGDIAVIELNEGVIEDANPFDLVGRTLRFTPAGGGYRVENLPLAWESEQGYELTSGRGGRGVRGSGSGPSVPGRSGAGTGRSGAGTAGSDAAVDGNVSLARFEFPFSGSSWRSLNVNALGNITYGGDYDDLNLPRFIHMRTLGPTVIDRVPLISAFMKQRMRGTARVNERSDRLVVTWDMTEPFDGNQDMTFEPTPHRFQAVLHADGRIDLSYEVMTATDGLVGVFPVRGSGADVEPVDLSAVERDAAPAPIVYEAFHHYGLPRPESLACTVIETFGDRFDFMVWYSDFRVDD